MADFKQGWEEEYKFQLHKRQLEKIMSGGEMRLDNTMPGSVSLGKLMLRRKDFRKSEESIAVYRSNQILLGKLEEISKRKSSYCVKQVGAPRTLNFQLRKDGLRRIARENFKVFQRIRSKEAFLCQKRLENEFKEHEKVKKMLAKRVRG